MSRDKWSWPHRVSKSPLSRKGSLEKCQGTAKNSTKGYSNPFELLYTKGDGAYDTVVCSAIITADTPYATSARGRALEPTQLRPSTY